MIVLGTVLSTLGDDFTFPHGLEDTTRVCNLLDTLLKMGVCARVVEKVAWGNFSRLFKEVVG